LNIGDVAEPLNAELIERNALVGNIDDRAFVPKLEKLAANHLVAIQVKGAERGLAENLRPSWLTDAVGGVVVCAGIFVDPMMVDGNEPSEYALVDDMKAW